MTTIVLADTEVDALHARVARCQILRPEWRILAFSNGQDVLNIIQTDSLDCVVSEITLPDMSGYELLRTLKQNSPHTVRLCFSTDLDSQMVGESASMTHRIVSKSLSDEALLQSIERSLQLRNALSNKAITDVVSEIHNLPSLPEVYREMTEELASPNSSLIQVVKLIEKDAALVATILKIVNSAFYGLNQQVESVSQAVSLLGVHLIKNITLTAKVFLAFEGSGVDMQALRALNDQANRTGALTNQFARLARVSRSTVNHAQVAGMLNGIGHLVALTLNNSHSKDNQDVKLCGAYLLRMWLLPDSVVEAVALQHDVNQTKTDVVTPLLILHCVQYLVENLTEVSDIEQVNSCQQYLASLTNTELANDWMQAYTDLVLLTDDNDLDQSAAA